MLLIADSGSTKTIWCLTDDKKRMMVTTRGINPFHQTEEEILTVLNDELLPGLHGDFSVDKVFFYGAGCTQEKSPIVRNAIKRAIRCENVHVESDLLGAARALCGSSSGIIGILGTGSNSCYYDGKDIVHNVSPLGYILGDEGSGAYIGKRLVADVLKCQLPNDICAAFYEETHLTAAEVIQRVYRCPLPNRFLASLSEFCGKHRDNDSVRSFLIDCFKQFFIRNVNTYEKCLAGKEIVKNISFIGSIAYFYKEELTVAAESFGFVVADVNRNPVEGLVKYHCETCV